MFPVVDWLMILITTIVTYKSYKKLVFDRYCSISFYVVFIVYIFCCVPIILNYLIGMPQYTVVYWYKAFIEPMNNVDVSAIYDIYITFAIFALYCSISSLFSDNTYMSFSTLSILLEANRLFMRDK